MSQNWQQTIPVRLRLALWVLLGLILGILLWATLATVSGEVVLSGRLEVRSNPASLKTPAAGRLVSRLFELGEWVETGTSVMIVDGLGVDERDTRLKLRSQQLRLGLAQRAERLGATPERQLRLKEEKARMAELAHLSRLEVFSPVAGRLVRVLPEGERVERGQVVAEIETQAAPPRFRGGFPVGTTELEPGQQVQIAWKGFPEKQYGTTPGTLVELSQDTQGSFRFAIAPQHLQMGELTLADGLEGQVRLRSKPKRIITLFWEWLRG